MGGERGRRAENTHGHIFRDLPERFRMGSKTHKLITLGEKEETVIRDMSNYNISEVRSGQGVIKLAF